MTGLLLLLVEVVFASIMKFCRWGSVAAEASYPRSLPVSYNAGDQRHRSCCGSRTPVKWNRGRPIPRFCSHGTPVTPVDCPGWLEPRHTPLSDGYKKQVRPQSWSSIFFFIFFFFYAMLNDTTCSRELCFHRARLNVLVLSLLISFYRRCWKWIIGARGHRCYCFPFDFALNSSDWCILEWMLALLCDCESKENLLVFSQCLLCFAWIKPDLSITYVDALLPLLLGWVLLQKVGASMFTLS